MRVLRVGHQEEGLAGGLGRAEEFSGMFGVESRVPPDAQLTCLDDEIPVFPPAGNNVGHLGQDARMVARLFQRLEQGRHFRIDLLESERPVSMRVAAGHPDRARRHADGDGDVGVVEEETLGGETVDVR